MKIINVGNVYEPVDDTIKVHEKLPSQSYVVRFSKQRGFFLEKYLDIQCGEEKVYGVHEQKVEKVFKSFGAFNRNLGIILSGDKGIGKSLFARMLSVEAGKRDIPTIVVDSYIPGIASYLESIDQEVLVLFDEFDKTFGDVSVGDGEADPQSQLLSLFDGIYNGKKLFVITCNKISKLNDYLVNRPGRFHYHFRFDYPAPDAIREYLNDKLSSANEKDINDVVMFSCKVPLNYDCLRAIAFELNSGNTFKEAIDDLNILNYDMQYYNMKVIFKDERVLSRNSNRFDLFGAQENSVSFFDSNGDWIVDINFHGKDCVFSPGAANIYVNVEDAICEYADSDSARRYQAIGIEAIILTADRGNNYRYAL